MKPKDSLHPGDLSRRDVLLVIAAYISAAAYTIWKLLRGKDLGTSDSHKSQEWDKYVPISRDFSDYGVVIPHDDRDFQGEQLKIVQEIERDYGIQIVSPKSQIVNGTPQENLPWGTEDIAIVAEAIRQLPPEYIEHDWQIREILLLRTRGSTNPGAGDISPGNGSMALYTSETFAPDNLLPGFPGLIFYKEGIELFSTVTHGFTHPFVNKAYPDILESWIAKIGWTQDNTGKWRNDHTIPYGRADLFPGEDIAVSASLLGVNKNFLTKDRIKFFLENEHYASWEVVQRLKERS